MAFRSPSDGAQISPNQQSFGIPGQTKVSGDHQRVTTHEICFLADEWNVHNSWKWNKNPVKNKVYEIAMLYKYGFTPLCFLLRLNSSFKKMPVAMKSILNTNVKCCCKFADIIFQTFFRSNHLNLVRGKYDKNLPKKHEDICFLKKEEGEFVFEKVY